MEKVCLCLAVWCLLAVSLVWGVGHYIDSLAWVQSGSVAELQKLDKEQ